MASDRRSAVLARTVLLADRSDDARAALRGLLEDEGFVVFVADTLDEARSILRQRDIGVLFLMLELGGVDGETLIEELETRPARGPLRALERVPTPGLLGQTTGQVSGQTSGQTSEASDATEGPALVVAADSTRHAMTVATQHAVPYVVRPYDLALACTTILVAYETSMRPLRRRSSSGAFRRVGG